MVAKPKAEDTRTRIIDAADALFRRLGYAKTAVADIATELGMSAANVYRFFPSKNAIVQAICSRCLSELDEKAWAAARSKAPAAARLERLVLDILAYHRANLLSEKRVHDMVLVAMEDNWQAIVAHKEVVRTAIELVIRDGIEAGDFVKVDPRETSHIIQRSLIVFCHPLMIAQGLQDDHDLETEARESVRFLLRAITPNRTPDRS
jgi:AcrR family transcriptional regulator